MKALISIVAWAVAAGAILHASLWGEGSVMFQGPWAVLGLGLIGLGILKETYTLCKPVMTEATIPPQR